MIGGPLGNGYVGRDVQLSWLVPGASRLDSSQAPSLACDGAPLTANQHPGRHKHQTNTIAHYGFRYRQISTGVLFHGWRPWKLR
jgi:hypothetical protein